MGQAYLQTTPNTGLNLNLSYRSNSTHIEQYNQHKNPEKNFDILKERLNMYLAIMKRAFDPKFNRENPLAAPIQDRNPYFMDLPKVEHEGHEGRGFPPYAKKVREAGIRQSERGIPVLPHLNKREWKKEKYSRYNRYNGIGSYSVPPTYNRKRAQVYAAAVAAKVEQLLKDYKPKFSQLSSLLRTHTKKLYNASRGKMLNYLQPLPLRSSPRAEGRLERIVLENC
jgi:hypothetical protein